MINNQKGKKLLSVFLSVVLALSSFSIVFAESSEIRGHWAEKQLGDWIDRGLMTGYLDGSYKPNNNITRSEFVALVNRIYQFDEKTEPGFTDVSAEANQWVYDEVSKAKKAGYINGFVDGSFKPNDSITRQEVAAIISRIEKLEPNPDSEILKNYVDANDIPEWSKADIGAVVVKGYMRGTPENQFKALAQIARAEVVTALDRVATKDLTAADAKPLFDAIRKQQEIKTMESKGSLYLALKADGLSEEEQAVFDEIADVVNSTKIDAASKAVMNDDGTKVTAETSLSAKAKGFDVNTTIWVDMDMSGDTQKLTEVVKVPEILAGFMPEELQGKEYLVIDDQGANQSNAGNPKELMEASKKLQDSMMKIIEKYMDEANTDFGIVKDRGIKVINTSEGKDYARIYQIRLDDATLKAVIKNSVNDLAQDKDFIKLVKEYMLMMAEFETNPEVKAELEKAAAELENNTDAFIASFNKAMDILDDVKLIGQRGIAIDYTVNSQGYIINEKGNADFVVDTTKLGKAIAEIAGETAAEEPTTAGVYSIGIDFDTDIFNINGDIKVEMPTITKENSMTVEELAAALAAQAEANQDDTIE